MPAPKDKNKTEEWKEKIRKSAKKQFKNGMLESTKIKIRKNAKNNPNFGTKGKKLSKEARKKISEHNKKVGKVPPSRKGCGGNKASFRKGMIPWNKGKRNKLWERSGNPNWKGGVTKLNSSIRHLLEYLQWRSNVFERDNWTCQTCNIRGAYLEAHHIIEFCDIIKNYKIKSIENSLKCDELWDINNGVTLCKKCHNLTKSKRYKV